MTSNISVPSYLLEIMAMSVLIILGGIALVFIYSITYRYLNKDKDRLRSIFRERCQIILLGQRYVSRDDIDFFRKLKVDSNRNIRTIFVRTLLEYYNFLKGEERTRVGQMYRALDLNKKDSKDLNSFLLGRKLRALHRVGIFEVPVPREQIETLQKSSDHMIRELANIYALRVFEDNFLDFLYQPGIMLSRWERLSYFQLITQRRNFEPPEFSVLIDENRHTSVNSFALDLISYYYQDEAAEHIHEAIPASIEWLRAKMIATLGNLLNRESIDFLLDWYPKETSAPCRRQIVATLGELGVGDQRVIDFLFDLLHKTEGINLRKKIIIALKSVQSSEDRPLEIFDELELSKPLPRENRI